MVIDGHKRFPNWFLMLLHFLLILNFVDIEAVGLFKHFYAIFKEAWCGWSDAGHFNVKLIKFIKILNSQKPLEFKFLIKMIKNR
jgi:hypothetical protein